MPSLTERYLQEKYEVGGLPKAWGVLYSPPNKDGSGKKCQNCFLWVKPEEKCLIHAKSLKVTEHEVCGYHCYGTPREKWEEMGISPVSKELSGLEEVGSGGSRCGTCEYFEKKTDKNGFCHAVVTEDKTPQPVETMGCCSRWHHK